MSFQIIYFQTDVHFNFLLCHGRNVVVGCTSFCCVLNNYQEYLTSVKRTCVREKSVPITNYVNVPKIAPIFYIVVETDVKPLKT